MFKEIPVDNVSEVFEKIGKEYMLITASDGEKVNSMTASWGCLGILWNMPVAICFIRPQRYTFGLVEKSDKLSLSFFGKDYREALGICGSKSGKNCDKLALAGLTPAFDSNGTPYIAESRLSLICRKLYAAPLEEARFVDPAILSFYSQKDYHTMYICKIEQALEQE